MGKALAKTSGLKAATPETAKPAVRRVEATRQSILDATKQILCQRGYAGLSTRDVALTAGVPLSQIHYHFSSKQRLVVAMFTAENARLLERQTKMYAEPNTPISVQWNRACDYLDDDLKSGYVRTLMELWAAGWSDPEIAEPVRSSITGWMDLLTGVARRAEKELGALDPFGAEDISALVGAAFIGAEAFLLLGAERTPALPARPAAHRRSDPRARERGKDVRCARSSPTPKERSTAAA
jgi:AcrR family transcriptional regulator